MASPGVNLNNGPPLPPDLQPPPQATMAGLSGQQASPNGSAALQQAVVEKLMMVEKIFDDIARIAPDAAPVLSGLVDQMRKGMGAILAKGAQPAPSPGAGGGMMLAGGAPTS